MGVINFDEIKKLEPTPEINTSFSDLLRVEEISFRSIEYLSSDPHIPVFDSEKFRMEINYDENNIPVEVHSIDEIIVSVKNPFHLEKPSLDDPTPHRDSFKEKTEEEIENIIEDLEKISKERSFWTDTELEDTVKSNPIEIDVSPIVHDMDGINSIDVGRRPSKEIKDYKVISSRSRLEDYRTDPSLVEAGGMSPLEILHHMGPDFMTNKFDVFFLWDPRKIEEELRVKYDRKMLPDHLTDLERFVVSHNGFAVRTADVSIPYVYNDEYEVNILETKIKKIRSKKIFNNQSSFSIRLDQDLFWLDQISLMSGRMNTRTILVDDGEDIHTRSNRKYYESMGFLDNPTFDKKTNYRYLFKMISKTWTSQSYVGDSMDGYDIKDYGLCLVVKMAQLGNFMDTKVQQYDLPYFVFENVRILGTGDSISYQRNSEIQEVKVDFIFRRFYQVVPKLGSVGTRWRWNTMKEKVGDRIGHLRHLSDDDIVIMNDGSGRKMDKSALFSTDVVENITRRVV